MTETKRRPPRLELLGSGAQLHLDLPGTFGGKATANGTNWADRHLSMDSLARLLGGASVGRRRARSGCSFAQVAKAKAAFLCLQIKSELHA